MGLGRDQFGAESMPMPQLSSGARGKGGKEINPNDISLLSIPKQTKLFVEALRSKTDQVGSKVVEF